MTSNVSDLVKEYRPTMGKDILHSWARDILAALIPAEQCFSVKEGYDVDAWDARRCLCPLTEALTIRSAKEVRREALEAADNAMKTYIEKCEAKNTIRYNEAWAAIMAHLEQTRDYIRALIDTPAPSTDTTPSVAESAKVLVEFTKDKGFQNIIDKVGEVKRRSFQGEFHCALRALSEQTGKKQ